MNCKVSTQALAPLSYYTTLHHIVDCIAHIEPLNEEEFASWFQYNSAPGLHHSQGGELCKYKYKYKHKYKYNYRVAPCIVLLCIAAFSGGAVCDPNQGLHAARALGIRSPRTVIRYLLLLQTNPLFSYYF